MLKLNFWRFPIRKDIAEFEYYVCHRFDHRFTSLSSLEMGEPTAIVCYGISSRSYTRFQEVTQAFLFPCVRIFLLWVIHRTHFKVIE